MKFYRLSDATFYDDINTIYQFIKPFWDKKKMPIFEKYGHKKNSTLSFCEISVCASKRLFLLVTKKKISHKPCEESNGTAQMHPGRRYTIWDCYNVSNIFHCSRMKKADARNGSVCS